MRVCLVGAPTVAEFADLKPLEGEPVPRYPLGVLCLASTLEGTGLRPEVVDLDVLYRAWVRHGGGREGFALHVAERLARAGADVYGFSTICSSYPLTLRIATALRKERPDGRIVLGGPQASVAASETLAAFPAVDVVVRGEGEATLPALLEVFSGSRDPGSVPGLTYRSGGGVVSTADAPLLTTLDSLPLPAFHLHPHAKRPWALPLEVGRGCPFGCSFCSTNRFFGRRFRMKSPSRILEDMSVLGELYGTKRFVFVHDNFTVDRRDLVAFCEAAAASGSGFTWSCSSRTDTLDDELVDLMWRAGCRGIFFGIESGSSRIQTSMGKRLDLGGARRLLRRVSRRRVTATLSFITGFPDETREDLRDTLSFFVDSLRWDYLEPQISLLSPLTGTPIQEQHRDELIRDEIVSDMAFQGEEQDRADLDLVERHPAIFSSFYSVPTSCLDRQELHELRTFLLHARFELRWLLVAAAQLEGALAVFEGFRAWRLRARPDGSPRAIVAYYGSATFRRDFVRFARDHLAARHPAARHALGALARYYRAILRSGGRTDAAPGAGAGPRLPANVRVTRLPCDGAALIEALRSEGDLAGVPKQGSALVTRIKRGRHEMIGVTGEAADLLELCDGTRAPGEVARAFERMHPRVCGVSGSSAALYGLEKLRRRGLIALSGSRAPGRASPGAPSSPRAGAGPGRRPSSARAARPGRAAPRRAGRAGRASAP